VPQGDRLVGGFLLALACRLRPSGIPSGKLGVEVCDRFARELGNGRALARRHVGGEHRPELPEKRGVSLPDTGQQLRLHPLRRTGAVGPRESGDLRFDDRHYTGRVVDCECRVGIGHGVLRQIVQYTLIYSLAYIQRALINI
jgi:hypothetical protein